MSKGQARNMQRISSKVIFGTARDLEGPVIRPPTIKQLRSIEIGRLTRIRYAFEVEQRLERAQASGESVGLLREQLAGIRNGTVAIPPGYGERPAGLTLSATDVHLRRGPDARTARPAPADQGDKGGRGRAKPLYRSVREAAADLADLAKGKLTMTGVATVRGLLERFDPQFVEAALSCPPGFLDKVKASSVYGLAPKLSAEDGLLLADALDERAPPPRPALPPEAQQAPNPAKDSSDTSSAPMTPDF